MPSVLTERRCLRLPGTRAHVCFRSASESSRSESRRLPNDASTLTSADAPILTRRSPNRRLPPRPALLPLGRHIATARKFAAPKFRALRSLVHEGQGVFQAATRHRGSSNAIASIRRWEGISCKSVRNAMWSRCPVGAPSFSSMSTAEWMIGPPSLCSQWPRRRLPAHTKTRAGRRFGNSEHRPQEPKRPGA